MAPRDPPAAIPSLTAGLRPGAFRRALVVIGVLTLVALAAMAVVMASGLARADMLLERLRRSQDQLAQVTRIQADVNHLRADVATGRPGVAARVAGVDQALAAYDRSVLEEGRALGGASRAGQTAEIGDAETLVAMFAALRAPLLAGGPPPQTDEQRFEALTDRVVARERAEAHAASLAMSDLRRTITGLAVAIPALIVLFGAAGVWLLRAANRDLEHQVRARTAEIEASRQALAEIDANRRLFFSKIGHELRTPATVIRGEAEVALRDGAATPERLREALEVVVANSGFLQRRLEDMLALASAEDGRLALRRDRVDVVEVTRAAVALAEPYVRASGLVLEADLNARGGAELDGDASWLQQAILAVVDNAAKFADERAPIRLSLSRRGGGACITVADSGPGVAAGDLPRLFDSWYQTAGGRARGGSGLGLSIARWVVEQHGGEIRAQSSPGKGLTIHIELPVRA